MCYITEEEDIVKKVFSVKVNLLNINEYQP